MSYKKSSIDIIGEVVAAMTFPCAIVDYVNNGSGLHTLTLDNMYHAQPDFNITIGVNTYVIRTTTEATVPACADAGYDVITIFGDAGNIAATSFNMYTPKVFHGTPIAQGVELEKKSQYADKVPMGWFMEQYKDHYYEDETQNKDRDIQFRYFFLTQGKPDKWTSADALRYGIKPMKRLAERFVEQIKTMPYLFDVDRLEYDMFTYAKFGVYINNKGMENSLWHDKLSGVELNFSALGVYRRDRC